MKNGFMHHYWCSNQKPDLFLVASDRAFQNINPPSKSHFFFSAWADETNQVTMSDLMEQSALWQIWLMLHFRSPTGDFIQPIQTNIPTNVPANAPAFEEDYSFHCCFLCSTQGNLYFNPMPFPFVLWKYRHFQQQIPDLILDYNPVPIEWKCYTQWRMMVAVFPQ